MGPGFSCKGMCCYRVSPNYHPTVEWRKWILADCESFYKGFVRTFPSLGAPGEFFPRMLSLYSL